MIFQKRDPNNTVAVDDSHQMKGEEENVFKEGDQGRFERNNCRGAKRSGTASFLQVIGEKPFKTFNKQWAMGMSNNTMLKTWCK